MKPRREMIEVTEQTYYQPKFFKVYNHVQELYAARVGFQAWGIYCILKQYADWGYGAPWKATVSHARIAIIWGCTTRTVRRGIRRLRDFGLIQVKKNQSCSTYTILRIPEPRKKKGRQDKNVLSDRTQMSLQIGQKRPIDQTLFTRPSLPTRAPAERPSKGLPVSTQKKLKKLEEQIEKLTAEGVALMERKGYGHKHPDVKQLIAKLDQLKDQRKRLRGSAAADWGKDTTR